MQPAKDKDVQKFRTDTPALVVLDLGNSALKGMLAGDSKSETMLKHEIVFPNVNKYERMAKRAKERSVEYEGAEFFKKLYRNGDERLVMIGDGVTNNSRSNKLTGEAKYTEGYFDVLLGAMLKQLLPDGHSNIWVALATPSDAIDYLDIIKPIIGGVHKLEALDGSTLKYSVKRLMFWEEPQGGMLRFMAKNERANNAVNIQPNQRIIVIDIGGKISSMSVVGIGDDLEPTVLYNESPAPFNLGIIDAKERFAEELKGIYPEKFKLFKTASSIPEYMLDDGLRNGSIMLSGEEFDVTQPRLNALANILDEIETRYNNDLSGGAIASHIVCSGGGGGLLIPALRLDVLNHKSVHLADDVKTIQFANMRGGAEALVAWLERKGFIDG